MQTEKFLSIKQVSELLDVAPITVRRLIKAKRLRASKIGSQYRIGQQALNDLINDGDGK